MAPIVNYEMKNQNNSASSLQKETNTVIDFANQLLAKHEANMRRREKDGLYSAGRVSNVSSKADNHESVSKNYIAPNVSIFEDITDTKANVKNSYKREKETFEEDNKSTQDGAMSHFRSLQRVEELDESAEQNLNSALKD